ncbi:MAG: 4-hydroxy-3-methylbut-2-enyl diphosphate reductase [Opitutales bacterium]|nr:4-hydroxy-3-methylbut-2-enyl diphosphate reductase [Opitutales bacterium]MBP3357562.1 4-hydroxy-3-methylbut-2-enyl diphosphate reductase [Opitutales bacterium]MBQ2722985.1 4-hydroxy-3-methylbut-2-enyl diphosphate reductase [Opitutales bacterium]
MKVIRAESAGFCFGVERAINIATTCTENGKCKVYTDGPLIHNRQMMERLTNCGIHEIGDYKSESEIDSQISDTSQDDKVLVIRAHGVSPERRKYLMNLGMRCKDATCPDVGKIAGTIKMHANKNYTTIIVGDPNHPEVIGLLGYAGGKGFVVKSNKDIDALPNIEGDICMVSQSTMFTDDYNDIAEYLKKRFPQTKVIDTICGATKTRQKDVVALAEKGAQAIVVIGGKHSANTVKLAIMAQRTGLPCFHIETVKELDIEALKKFDVVGVTAGASTPDFLINEVCNTLEKL